MFWLLGATNLTAAFLIFTIQPLISKLALPYFGGSAMVWSTALMVFQGGLLVGYFYAHALSRLTSTTTQAWIHCGVAALSLLALPIAFMSATADEATDLSPSLRLSISLIASIGLPYLVVCTTSPLTQRWYYEWTTGLGRDPYRLYSLSNAGSLLALLSFPFVIEPLLNTDSQRLLWSWCYALLLLTLTAFMVARLGRNPQSAATTGVQADPATWRQRSRWLMFAFVPSLYLMGVTLHIGIDVAAAPFVWVPPLVLYLLSFVVVFARPAWGAQRHLLTVQAGVVIALCIYFFYANLLVLLSLHLLGLFLACMVCHGRLASERPHAAGLTGFYIWMALGGWLGGVAGALLAPAIFNGNWEYLIAIAAACLLRPEQADASRRMDLLAPVGLSVLLLALIAVGLQLDWNSYPVFAVFAIAAYSFRLRPLRFTLAVVPWLIGNQVVDSEYLHFRERSFYGIYEIGPDESGGLKQLTHGTTLHGAQILDPEAQTLPLAYYNPEGPLGQVMLDKRAHGLLQNVGVVGLGVGTIACYAEPDTQMTFFEIDPLIARIAKTEFAYLDRCGDNATVVIGDGRLSLEQAADQRFDVLVIDAFSSDAVPLHMLTVEAMETYLERLHPRGVLLFHISNRYIDLSGVLARLAAAHGAVAFMQSYEPTTAEEYRAAAASDWVWISAGGAPPSPERWEKLSTDGNSPLWTDRYSNLLNVIAWKKVL